METCCLWGPLRPRRRCGLPRWARRARTASWSRGTSSRSGSMASGHAPRLVPGDCLAARRGGAARHAGLPPWSKSVSRRRPHGSLRRAQPRAQSRGPLSPPPEPCVSVFLNAAPLPERTSARDRRLAPHNAHGLPGRAAGGIGAAHVHGERPHTLRQACCRARTSAVCATHRFHRRRLAGPRRRRAASALKHSRAVRNFVCNCIFSGKNKAHSTANSRLRTPQSKASKAHIRCCSWEVNNHHNTHPSFLQLQQVAA